ncbi:hypothetical protein OGAPHI_001187 [Ogataea philodendri]|uniref:J domain-containing protein n=1 Tax=Ogataea philodendri TaxID=1378263 RepID=A0A9P8PF19_9ASCO|nr:uncharacterized protein OGAPHI_001187 [Ogataea philodendri]KAH3670672.1 hypothetical protein OGAPHI_001187 [Ogataea philodendri]
MNVDHYEILEVAKTASDAEIKKSFRRLALKYHPDKNKDTNAEDKFKQINDSYTVLMDPQRRAEFDRTYVPRTSHKQSFTPNAAKKPSAYEEYERARRQYEEFKRRQEQEKKAREEARQKQAADWGDKWSSSDSFYHYSRYTRTSPVFEPEFEPSSRTKTPYSFASGEKTYTGPTPNVKTEKPRKWTSQTQDTRTSADFAEMLREFNIPQFNFSAPKPSPSETRFASHGTPDDPIILDTGTQDDPIVVDDQPSRSKSPKKPKQRFWKPAPDTRFKNRTTLEEQGENQQSTAHKANVEDVEDSFRIHVENVPPFTQTTGNFDMSEMGESLGVETEMNVDREDEHVEPVVEPLLSLADLRCNQDELAHISPPVVPQFHLTTQDHLRAQMADYMVQAFNYQHLVARYTQTRQEANAQHIGQITANPANMNVYRQSLEYDRLLNTAHTQFLETYRSVLDQYELELSKYV